jgi:hypothetical protein
LFQKIGLLKNTMDLFLIFQFSKFSDCLCGSSSVGRATAFQAVGRGFEPRLPLFPAVALAKAGLSTEVFAKASRLR